AARRALVRKLESGGRDARPVSERPRGDWREDRRARPAAAHGAPLLRQVSGPDPLRHRCRAARLRNAAAGVRRSAVSDLLSVPRARGWVFRPRAVALAAAGALADLRRRPAGADPAQGVLPERGTHPRIEARDGVTRPWQRADYGSMANRASSSSRYTCHCAR